MLVIEVLGRLGCKKVVTNCDKRHLLQTAGECECTAVHYISKAFAFLNMASCRENFAKKFFQKNVKRKVKIVVTPINLVVYMSHNGMGQCWDNWDSWDGNFVRTPGRRTLSCFDTILVKSYHYRFVICTDSD